MRLWPITKDCEWDNEGASVLLPYCAKRHEVEAALSSIGLYAPRGADSLEWGAFPNAVATIFDADGEVLIHLLDHAP